MTNVSIFIVEDDAHFRDTFIDVMSLRGVEVQGASTGEEGLKVLRGCRPSVIILDVNLPDMHGFDLCRRIKKLEPFKNTPVMFVSASAQYSDPRDRVEGLLAGATFFLPKPVTMEKLWEEIEFLLRHPSS
ncbi:MAG: response regulator [Elusimicrobia bacterium]|nr:response regulator [Elusimicrobiota bacterium]